MPIRNPKPVVEYLKEQKRFRHLFKEGQREQEELEHVQALADYNIERYNLKGIGEDELDSEGADTVGRRKIR